MKENFQQIIDDTNTFLHKYLDNKDVKLRILRLVAYIHIDIEKYSEVIYCLKQEYKINPESSRINLALGNLKSELKNYNEALRHYNKTFILDSSNGRRSIVEQNIAAVYLEQKNILKL